MLLPALALLFSTGILAQNKVTVFCRINPQPQRDNKAFIDYGILEKILPDSLKTSLLTDVSAQYGFRNRDAVLQWMLLHQWKIAAAEGRASGWSGTTESKTYVWLSREINLDNASLEVFNNKLLAAGKEK